jgi:hypothetical protein
LAALREAEVGADPEITPLSRAGLDRLIGWADEEGWNPGLDDAERFWAADPDAFVALRDGNEMIGAGAGISYGSFGFMGLFIVRPDLRGAGLGRGLWRQLRERLEHRLQPGATIGLDGVLAMEPFYGADGFRTSHRHLRMRGTGVVAAADPGLRPLAEIPFAAVAELDRDCFGCEREAFLRPWVEAAGAIALGLEDAGELLGYGVARPCGEGFKIGPLFAADATSAERLLAGLGSAVAGERIFLDVPDRNPEALALAAELGMEQVFACARMYRGEPPPQDRERIFGNTTLELG